MMVAQDAWMLSKRRSCFLGATLAPITALVIGAAGCSSGSPDPTTTTSDSGGGAPIVGSLDDAGSSNPPATIPDASKGTTPDAQSSGADAGSKRDADGSDGGAASEGGGGGADAAESGIGAILSEATFESMFPNRNAIYTYAALLQAAAAYPAFATTGSSDDRKREVAAFLANVAHETGALVYVNEIAQAAYCSPTTDCPCASGQEYFGRGSLQLSWNYNYCAAGQALGQNLQANPDLVATDSALAWGTGIWFWMTSTGAGSQTCHDGILASGFGATIQTINGGIECNGGAPSSVQDRVQYYTTFCATFGVSPGNNTSC
jgi:predicted chitinase